MSNTRAAYEGYIMEARPQQLAKDGRWATEVVLERHYGSGVNVCPYYGQLTFETKDEAIRHSLIVGAQIIDGVYPGCVAP
jgi:hypothetical protein